MINHYLLRVAQGELAIAVFLGDGELWERAMNKIKIALGSPWHKRQGSNLIH